MYYFYNIHQINAFISLYFIIRYIYIIYRYIYYLLLGCFIVCLFVIIIIPVVVVVWIVRSGDIYNKIYIIWIQINITFLKGVECIHIQPAFFIFFHILLYPIFISDNLSNSAFILSIKFTSQVNHVTAHMPPIADTL